MVPDDPIPIVTNGKCCSPVVCYAPVFEGKPCRCWVIIPGLVLAIIALAPFIWIPGVLCLIKKLVFRIKHCSSGNDVPNIEL
ncbi:MAG: hypothetical protein ACTSSH_08060 [Candidatus Heimdallarchaeota archaeon]